MGAELARPRAVAAGRAALSGRSFAAAWHDSLYGPGGFYRCASPGAHFRTSAHVGDVLARAVLTLVRREGLGEVVDLGAGAGELLAALHRLAEPGELRLVGVDVRPRPAGLPETVQWCDDGDLPPSAGLLVAHEWLDDLPCPVVEVDDDGVPREVLVDPVSGAERLGDVRCSAWLERWWPLTGPGSRAEDGGCREEAWAAAVASVAPGGVALAVDYGHLRESRPRLGSLRAYADGREVDVRLDGSCDVTAHVAVDALAERTGGLLLRQRDALLDLGVRGTRPDRALATRDPAAYVAALSQAGDEAELLAPGGLGDHWWLVVDR